jgi:hypothetical protein
VCLRTCAHVRACMHVYCVAARSWVLVHMIECVHAASSACALARAHVRMCSCVAAPACVSRARAYFRVSRRACVLARWLAFLLVSVREKPVRLLVRVCLPAQSCLKAHVFESFCERARVRACVRACMHVCCVAACSWCLHAS